MKTSRTFIARYAGACHVCGTTISVGDLIAHTPNGVGCPSCLGAQLGATTAGLGSRGVHKTSQKASTWRRRPTRRQ